MKSKRGIYARLLLWSLALLLAAPPGGIMAQGQDPGGQPTFRQEELDQMLAPIALYPDDLLVQVLMAATYPLEVVQAARWVQENPNLPGDQLAAALEQQNWDPSVKSLVNFPTVLQMLNDRLEWTQKLGDAFLAQKDQVMDTVQKLRQRAQGQGYLQTTSQEMVVVDPQSQAIAIEPATPQAIYVPVYDPTVAYGPWWWPAYPPYYYYPPGVVITGGFIGFGVALGLAWGYAWGGFDWHRHGVMINVTRNVRFNNRINRNRYVSHVTTGGGGQGAWRHDPAHRGGVAYRTPSVAQQFGRQTSAQPRVAATPAQARPAAPRQVSSPGPQGVQGLRSPTAFGSGSPGNQTRQASSRGHQSLSSAHGPAPAGNRTSSGKASGGGASHGDGHK
ncbi:MAG: DUF3300 domain-containing protein [Syntrophorhabdales bacterium]